MNPILAAIAADPNIHPAFRAAIAPPVFYQAKTGRRRTYLSQNGADAYDCGYGEYIIGEAPVMDKGPYSDGQWDAFSAEEERAWDSLEAHESDVCKIDDEERA